MRAFITLMVVLFSLLPGLARAQDVDLVKVFVVPPTAEVGADGELRVQFTVPEGFHVYRDMFEIRMKPVEGLSLGEPSFPQGKVAPDPAFPEQTREMYDADILAQVPLSVSADLEPGDIPIEVTVRHQTCRGHLCFLPTETTHEVALTLTAPEAAPDLSRFGERPDLTEDDPVAVRAIGGEGVVEVAFFQAPGWHVNRDLTFVELAEGAPLQVGDVGWPEGEVYTVPDLGLERVEIGGDFVVTMPLRGPPGRHELQVLAGYQACKVDICHMPRSVEFEVAVAMPAATGEPGPTRRTSGGCLGTPASAGDLSSPSATAFQGQGTALAGVSERGIFWLLLFVFGAGVLVSLTPCVLPLVPITVGIIGARSAGSRLQALVLSLFYVAGLALVYTSLGVFSGLTGSLFGAWMQSPWVVGAVALFFAAMGLAMFGIFDVTLPSSLASRLSRVGGAGYGGAFLVGMVGAVVAGPCSGPVVASLMVLVGSGGQLILGATLMLAFSLGLGLIFLLAGTFSGAVLRPGPWMDTVKRFFGVVLLLGAVFYAQAHLSDLVVALLTAGVLLVTAVFGWPAPEDGSSSARLHKLYGVVGGIVGGWLLVWSMASQGFILPPVNLSVGPGVAVSEGIAWETDEARAMALAAREGRPLVVDFTADWCAACKDLDRDTFSDSRVVDLSRSFVSLKVDATRSGDPAVERTLERYSVKGLPTVLFLDPSGEPLSHLTVTGFVDADDFLGRMEAALTELELR